MSLLFDEKIKNDAKLLMKSGTVIGLAIINSETAEIVSVFGSEVDGLNFLRSYDFKDEIKYASTRIRLVDLVNNGCIVEV